MESKIKESYLKFKLIHELFESNPGKWKDIEQFQSSYDEFVKNFNNLEGLSSVTETDLRTDSGKMKKQREKVIEYLIPVADLLNLYSADHDKKKLKKLTDKVRKKAKGLSGAKTIKYARQLIDKAERIFSKEIRTNKKEKDLGSYGLSAGMIDSLRNAVTKFEDFRNRYKSEKLRKKDAEREIRRIIKANDKIIKDRFDRFMSIFIVSDQQFHDAYIKAKLGIMPDAAGKKDKKAGEAAKEEATAATAEKKTGAKRGRKPSTTAKKTTAKRGRKPGRPKGSKNKQTVASKVATATPPPEESAKEAEMAGKSSEEAERTGTKTGITTAGATGTTKKARSKTGKTSRVTRGSARTAGKTAKKVSAGDKTSTGKDAASEGAAKPARKRRGRPPKSSS